MGDQYVTDVDDLPSSFTSRKHFISQVKSFLKKKTVLVSVAQGGNGRYGRLRVVLKCTFGGSPRNKKKGRDPIRLGSTGKMGCPFTVRGYEHADGSWGCSVSNNVHNHVLDISHHAIMRKLDDEEIKIVITLNDACVPVRFIAAQIREHRKEKKDGAAPITAKDISNELEKQRRIALSGRSPTQYLYDTEIAGGKVDHRIMVGDDGRLKNLFFIPKATQELTRVYQNVLVLDCTYKTNKYKLPLLHGVGVTALNTSFTMFLAFLINEKEESYVWALNSMSELGIRPAVIIHDNDHALLKSIKVVLPNASTLLCRWHIGKNILSNCRKHFDQARLYEKWLDNYWYQMINSDTPEELNAKWIVLKENSADAIVEYIQSTWMPLKHLFMTPWVKNISHFGNLDSSRCEGMHSVLKKYILTCTGDLLKVGLTGRCVSC